MNASDVIDSGSTRGEEDPGGTSRAHRIQTGSAGSESHTLRPAVVFNAQGLVPVVVQDATSLAVLMLAWMDEEALRRTSATGRATYWSRSRREYWVKGETSGHTQHVVAIRSDCDGDTLLLTVEQTGPACHTGATTCFDARPALPLGTEARSR